jgi:hypothetical protein
MEFMSPEHVSAMNDVLAGAADVRAECARLAQPRLLAYRLTSGPGGADVHWTLRFTENVQFGLGKPVENPDVELVSDWAAMIRATAATRAGIPTEPPVTLHGNAAVLAEVATALEAARRIATFEVEFPRVL